MSDYFAPGAQRHGSQQHGTQGATDWSKLSAANVRAHDQTWTAPEAFLGVLLAAMLCDGGAATEEIEALQAILNRSRSFKTIPPEQLSGAVDEISARIQSNPDCVAAACAALPEDMRATAFALALDLILADNELTRTEAKFLNDLTSWLQLDNGTVQHISEVIVVKNSF